MKSADEIFNYYGSSFKLGDLKIISLNDLGKFSFCPGHLFFYSKINDQLTPMKRAGEIVEKEFIEKYKRKGLETFHIYTFTDPDRVALYKKLWTNLKNAKFEHEKLLIAEELTRFISADYFLSTRSMTVLNFI